LNDKFYFVSRLFLEIDSFLTTTLPNFQEEKQQQWDVKSILNQNVTWVT
jgi:hypothetical protein